MPRRHEKTRHMKHSYLFYKLFILCIVFQEYVLSVSVGKHTSPELFVQQKWRTQYVNPGNIIQKKKIQLKPIYLYMQTNNNVLLTKNLHYCERQRQ